MSIKIADRMSKIDSSGIRKVFNLAAKIDSPINLSIGQPDFKVPERIKRTAIKAIRSDKNSYTVTQGIFELNSLVKEIYKKRYNFNSESSIITSGVSGGLLLALMALVDPGDEVLMPDPGFVMYKHLVNLLSGVPVFYETYPDFRINREQFSKLFTKKTKVLIVNSPSNPTGMILPAEDLIFIAKVAKENNVFIISDEIYDDFSYDEPYRSICEFCDKDNLLILNGFSKSLAITGWRVGYALGPDKIISEMIKLQQYSFVCAPSFAQYALLEFLKVDRKNLISSYKKKRDIIYEGLKDNFNLVKPKGAFYAFPEKPERFSSSSLFVEEAIKQKVLIIPGNVFSERDTHFRISFAADNKILIKGIEILNNIAKGKIK